MRRNILFLFTILLIVLSLSACGNSSEDYSDTNQSYSTYDDIDDEDYSDNDIDDEDYSDVDQNVDDDYIPTPVDDPDYKLKEIKKNPPQLFMREADLAKTSLGKPGKIEKCRDFDHYDKDHKSKEYTWGSYEDKTLWKVTVRYKRSQDGTVNNYEIYPDDNGYVAELFYYNPNTGYYESENEADGR